MDKGPSKSNSEIRRLETESGNWKTGLFRYGFALIAFETISGTYLWATSTWHAPGMMLLLGHLLFGILMAVPCLMFPLRHRLYLTIWTDLGFSLLGWATSAFLLVSLFSGTYLVFSGVSGNAILWWIHNIFSYLGAFCAVFYIFVIIRRTLKSLEHRGKKYVIGIAVRTATAVFVMAAISTLFWALTGALYREPSPSANVEDVRNPFKNPSPFFPSQVNTSTGGYLKPEVLTRSKTCGTSGCHADILKQFEQSVHFRTPNVFVEKVAHTLFQQGDAGKLFDKSNHPQIKAFRDARLGKEVFRVCASCHAPVALLTGEVAPQKPLKDFRSHEGDSCILCHAIDKDTAVGSPPHIVTAPKRTLFWDSDHKALTFVHETLIRVKPEFHAKAFSKPSHKTSEYCAACHMNLQYTSWKDGPYSKADSGVEKKNCQDCHMPQVPVSDEASGKERGTVADHRFLSAGFTMAKYYGQPDQFQATERFIRDRKLSVHLFAPDFIPRAGRFSFAIRVANIGVGHSFPAGPEGDLTEAWLQVKIFDEKKNAIFESGKLDSNGYLDEKKTEIYRILDRRPVFRTVPA